MAAAAAAAVPDNEDPGLQALNHLEAGDLDAALRVGREVLETYPDSATAMYTIAQVQLARGEFGAAMQRATQMLALCKDQGNKAGQAAASLVLANGMLSSDSASMEGINCGREALSLFQEVDDIFGAQSALHTLANGYFARFDLEEGLKCAREALALFRQTGDTTSQEMLQATIEEARTMTQEHRLVAPKRHYVLPPSAVVPRASGPQRCPRSDEDEPRMPSEVLEMAAAGRKYWGNASQVEPDPTVDAYQRAPSHSVIFGMAMSDNTPTQLCVEFGDLVACMAKGDVAKIPIVVLTCGVFGRQAGEHQPASMTNVAAATIWGMARTVRQEIPSLTIQILDYAEDMTAAQIPRAIRPSLPESAYYHQARWEPQISAVSSLFRRDLRKDLVAGAPGGKDAEVKEEGTKFLRRAFNWTGPSHKMDFCWYRQEWRACGPAFEEPAAAATSGASAAGAGSLPPPCRAMRTC
mmetsp:Transcript_85192/g.178035  ORF Transcript_85192/g.178035 Transcript_85192/m.178035 type:complete len:467 (+) Transcript_85192:198-1598(+)